MYTYIGIDPGAAGAIAVLFPQSPSSPLIYDMPENLGDIRDLLDGSAKAATRARIPLYVAIERQQAMAKEGVRQGVSSTFATGMGYGSLLGLLHGLYIPHEVVGAQTWLRAMGVPAGAPKAKHVDAAQAMFPTAVFKGPRGGLKDGRADAALIAEWVRQRKEGEKS